MSENVGSQPSNSSIFGPDGKLSSASAATSLKYARAQDLPSYPSTGGVQLSSAGAAASLAASNQKSFEHWKPEPIPAANRAALLAKDHKMDPLWKPEASAAGSKAAMTAHANQVEIEPLQPKKTSSKTAAPSPAYDTPENTHRKALLAATASHNRRRSGSLPTQPVANADSSWALKAAAKSHKAGVAQPPAPTGGQFSTGDPGFEAARIQNVAKSNVNRQLYTSAPPVDIEVQEKNRQDTLKASAIAMAQKMYAIQQKHIDDASGKTAGDSQALAASRARSSTVTGGSDTASIDRTTSSVGYENLEEAARKLAQERLAKIHDEHAEYRNYYGQTSPNRSRLSMRMRRRASSAATDDSDEEQSRKIRSQMSIFQSKLADVDSKKRQQDRDNLIQIAHRNVDAQIQKLDEKVFSDTGKASPAQVEKWEKSAREKAQRDSDARMQNVGKVHIGGGKYLEQSELDAIARARLQPTLDDITEKAEKQRARDEEERLAREKKLEDDRLAKAELDRQKQEERTRKDEEKRVQREEDAAMKARRDEEKRILKEEAAADKERRKADARQAKEDKRKPSQHKPGLLSGFLGRGAGNTTATEADSGATTATTNTNIADEPTSGSQIASQGVTVHDQVTTARSDDLSREVTNLQEPTTTGIADTLVDPSSPQKSKPVAIPSENKITSDEEIEPASPSRSRVKSWVKGRFSAKGDKQKEGESTAALPEADTIRETTEKEDKSDEIARSDSMRDVALAGRTTTNETSELYDAPREVSPVRDADAVATQERQRSLSISSVSSVYSQEKGDGPPDFTLGTTQPVESDGEQRGRTGLKQRLLNKIKPSKEKPQESKSVEPVASNTTDDEFEEARDQFEEKAISPPISSLKAAESSDGKKTVTPGLGTSHEKSRFTEEL